MRVNKKLLDLNTLYENYKLGELFNLYDQFNDLKFDMEICLELLKEDYEFNQIPNLERDKEYKVVSTQLYYAKKNLMTIEKVILCHEDNVFDVFKNQNGVFDFCLN